MKPVKITSKGQITLPLELHKKLDLKPADKVEITESPLINLNKSESLAIEQFHAQIIDKFKGHIAEIRLFGSKIRGTSDVESDIDILVLVEQLDLELKEKIIDIAVNVNLQHDVLISPIIVDREKYFSPLYQETFFFKSTQSEGVAL